MIPLLSEKECHKCGHEFNDDEMFEIVVIGQIRSSEVGKYRYMTEKRVLQCLVACQ